MVRQSTSEIETCNVEDTPGYFHYLRNLADLADMASIMAVQVKKTTKNFFCPFRLCTCNVIENFEIKFENSSASLRFLLFSKFVNS